MSFAARRAGSLIFKRRMGGGSEPFFSEGKQTGVNGHLFNETPPPPGQSRKWESWEAPWYATLTAAAVILGVGLNSKPDTSIHTWARAEAKKDLAAK